MDDPHSDERKLRNTLKQFRLINFLFSASRKLICSYFIEDMKKHPQKKHTWVDLGCGGGDIAFWMYKEIKKNKLTCDVVMVDVDARVVRYLCDHFELKKTWPNTYRNPSHPGLLLFTDRLETYAGEIDYVFGNHFLHHLSWEEIEALLVLLQKKVKRGFLFNDLSRSPSAFILFQFYAGLFCHDSFAYDDGSLSIKRGFLSKEWQRFLKEKSFKNLEVAKRFPFRIVIYRSLA